MPEIFFDKEKYIAVKMAAKLTGYTNDYIGQLCRGNKIKSRMIGHSWYVSESAILEYQKGIYPKTQNEKIIYPSKKPDEDEISQKRYLLASAILVVFMAGGILALNFKDTALGIAMPEISSPQEENSASVFSSIGDGIKYLWNGLGEFVYSFFETPIIIVQGPNPHTVRIIPTPTPSPANNATTTETIYKTTYVVKEKTPGVSAISENNIITEVLSYINQKIDEKFSGLSTGLLQKISDSLVVLEKKITDVSQNPIIIFSGPAASTPVTTATFAAAQRIDNLSNVTIANATVNGVTGLTDADIPNGITASNYLLLTGGTLSGALNGTDLTLSGTLTAGSLAVSGVSSGEAVEAPYFTATSTTATSTFAGGFSAASSLYVLQNGNVGIGTTSPGSLLSIGNTTGWNFTTATSSSFATGGLNLNAGCYAIGGICLSDTASGIVGSGTQGQLPFYNSAGATLTATSSIFLAQNSNVGIGTTSPNYALDIIGNSALWQSVYGTEDGLLAYWPMSEGTGNKVYDHGPYAKDATLTNSTSASWSTGKYGSALNFVADINTGTHAMVSDTSVVPTGPVTGLTVELWFNSTTTATSENGRLIAKYAFGSHGPSFLVTRLNGTDDIIFSMTDSNQISGNATKINAGLSDGIWHHLVFTWDGLAIFMYKDGVAIASGNTSSFTGTMTGDWRITVGGRNAVNNVPGKIDEVKIYNRAISADEVKAHYLRTGTSNLATGIFRVVSTSTAESLRVTDTGLVGIGTTTPSSLFSVQGNGLISGNLTLANLTATGTVQTTNLFSTASSTIGGLLNVSGLTILNGALNASSTATSTFQNGIALSSGCFQTSSGACLGSGAAGSGVTTLNGLDTVTQTFSSNNTSSGWMDLTINSSGSTHTFTTSASTSPAFGFVVATSTTATSTFAGGFSAASSLYVLQNGNVGIGTTSPASTLTVTGSACVSQGAGVATVACSTTAGTISYKTANAANVDIAENYFVSDDSLEAGDIVALDTESPKPASIRKATGKNDVILGAVSTAPGMVLGFGGDGEVSSTRPVALAGRIPVKVMLDSAATPIKKGDLIAMSGVPGIGMKATSSGQTIGVALEDFDGIISNGNSSERANVGKILIFINLGWSNLDAEMFSIATSTLEAGSLDMASGKIKANYALDMDGKDIINIRSILSQTGNWSIDENGKLIVQEIQAKKLCLDDVCITKDELKKLLDGSTASPQATPMPTPEPMSELELQSSSTESVNDVPIDE